MSWPELYSYFFTTRQGSPNGLVSKTIAASSPLGQALQQLYQSDSNSFDLLSAVYGIERTTSGKLGTGQALWKIPGPGVGVAGIPMPPSAAAVSLLL